MAKTITMTNDDIKWVFEDNGLELRLGDIVIVADTYIKLPAEYGGTNAQLECYCYTATGRTADGEVYHIELPFHNADFIGNEPERVWKAGIDYLMDKRGCPFTMGSATDANGRRYLPNRMRYKAEVEKVYEGLSEGLGDLAISSLINRKLAAADRIPEAWYEVLAASLTEATECGETIESGEPLSLGGAQTRWTWIDPATFPMQYIDEYSALIEDEGHQGYYCYTGELEAA